MIKTWKRAGAVLAVLAGLSVTAMPASAQRSCWSPQQVKAAKVRDLQTLLMVGALQCRTSGHDVLKGYNRFVVNSRSVIQGHNDVLRARFVSVHGTREGQRAYDRFTTALANDHAANTGASDFCPSMVALADQAASSSRVELEALADRLIDRPRGVDRTCS